MRAQISLFEDQRMTLANAIDLTIQSLRAFGAEYEHWAMAYSGGKDSSALVSVVIYLINQGLIQPPKSLTVLYSDTRLELPPLQIGAMQTLETIRGLGYQAKVVLPELDKRYFVYMLGRGVPPPNNNTLRWCTPQIKVTPMVNELINLRDESGEKILMLTGVRIGESAARDNRIALSCGKNGAECGQGWFQETTPESVADTLAPLLHWRVCHVWDWLMFEAPSIIPSVSFVAQVYGGEEAEEINARTGCTGCPLATSDKALDHILNMPDWNYLAPLKRLRPLYLELRKFEHRKQKYGERNKDGKLSANPNRKGPLKLESRLWGLKQVLNVQSNINMAAKTFNRPLIDLINVEEEDRIRELINLKIYPNKWSDSDLDAEVLIPTIHTDGSVQNIFNI